MGISRARPKQAGRPHMCESLSNGGIFWELLLAQPEGRPDHPGTARVSDPDSADLEMLKGWKDECLSSHGAKCENPMRIPSARPAWLIDVERKCLVSGSVTDAPYLALSYVYGEHVAPTIDDEKFAELQERNALETPENSEYVLPIVKHAMGLTSVLGERHLWVDQLCIPHSDPASAREEQVLKMGAIYANAVVTITAADGDPKKGWAPTSASEAGLLGLRGISGPRNLRQRVIALGDEKLLVHNKQVYEFRGGANEPGPTKSGCCRRGKSTLLERQLHWECSCHVWHEEQLSSTKVDEFEYPDLSAMLVGFPDLRSLDKVIRQYNGRALRYDEDALPAISRLLSILSRDFPGGFLYGIPELFFERGLGWSPKSSCAGLRRRMPSDRRPAQDGQTSPPSSLSALPSWSWIGWEGEITIGDIFAAAEAAQVNDRASTIEETVPITTWFTGHFPSITDISQQREIKSTWYEERDKNYKDFSRPLPPGWTRHAAPETNHFGQARVFPDGCGEYVFRHEAMPEPHPDLGPRAEWYYPFPVPQVGSSSEAPGTNMPEQTPVLFCETTRAWLWGHQADNHGRDEVLLHTSGSGDEVGKLYLPNRSFLDAFPKGPLVVAAGVTERDGDEREEKRDLRVELVAIYKSRVREMTLNKETRRYGLPVRRSERYTVLWVEWKEGVAHRLASGHVRAEAWDALEREQVSLVLG
ncbi:hypothetical protein PG996_011187 [Apiospora saccharicola]|uniref:Heterokaryon incompatibility domain-containing protein n=1 Tax=Apiospora saccharicola TaxID=335842 RepID=A0ABR1UEC4_9PEZI